MYLRDVIHCALTSGAKVSLQTEMHYYQASDGSFSIDKKVLFTVREDCIELAKYDTVNTVISKEEWEKYHDILDLREKPVKVVDLTTGQ